MTPTGTPADNVQSRCSGLWWQTNLFLIINSGSGCVINQLSPVFSVGTLLEEKRKTGRFDYEFDRSANKEAPTTTTTPRQQSLLKIEVPHSSRISHSLRQLPTSNSYSSNSSSSSSSSSCVSSSLVFIWRRHDSNYRKILLHIIICHLCQWLEDNNAKRLQSNPLIKKRSNPLSI